MPDYEFTPSTEQVRAHYSFDQSDKWRADRGVAFDRWLSSVKAEAAATALEESVASFEGRQSKMTEKKIAPKMSWDELSDSGKAEGGYWIYPMKGLVWSSEKTFVRVEKPSEVVSS